MNNVIECDFESIENIRDMVRDIGATRTIEQLVPINPRLEVFIRAVVKNQIKRWRRGQDNET